MWGRLGFTDRVPAATTVGRLLIRIDAEALSAVLTRWLRARARPVVVPGRRWRLVIAIDGKVERGARLPDGRQVHLLSAYDTSAGVVLAQVQIAAKSNEIPAFAPLLDRLHRRPRPGPNLQGQCVEHRHRARPGRHRHLAGHRPIHRPDHRRTRQGRHPVNGRTLLHGGFLGERA
jgi:hypothetical protein